MNLTYLRLKIIMLHRTFETKLKYNFFYSGLITFIMTFLIIGNNSTKAAIVFNKGTNGKNALNVTYDWSPIVPPETLTVPPPAGNETMDGPWRAVLATGNAGLGKVQVGVRIQHDNGIPQADPGHGANPNDSGMLVTKILDPFNKDDKKDSDWVTSGVWHDNHIDMFGLPVKVSVNEEGVASGTIEILGGHLANLLI